METMNQLSTLPVGYTTTELEGRHFLGADDANTFIVCDAGSEDRVVDLPTKYEQSEGDTIWLAECGGQGNILTDDTDGTIIKPATLAAFVSKGTHWECIVSDLPWS
jgi:hypothetical protein